MNTQSPTEGGFRAHGNKVEASTQCLIPCLLVFLLHQVSPPQSHAHLKHESHWNFNRHKVQGSLWVRRAHQQEPNSAPRKFLGHWATLKKLMCVHWNVTPPESFPNTPLEDTAPVSLFSALRLRRWYDGYLISELWSEKSTYYHFWESD